MSGLNSSLVQVEDK